MTKHGDDRSMRRKKHSRRDPALLPSGSPSQDQIPAIRWRGKYAYYVRTIDDRRLS